VLHTTRHFSVAHAHILFYSKSDNPKFNTYCRFGPQELSENDYSFLGEDLRDVWHISRNNRPKRIKNPAHLPAELVRKIILYSSDPGDYVMDMFAGEFTTAREAIKLGRKAIAMEANPNAWSAAFHIEKFKEECLAMASVKNGWEQELWPTLSPQREGEPFSENEKKEIYEDYLIGRINGEHAGNLLKHLYQEYQREPYTIASVLAEMAGQDDVETLHTIKRGQDLPNLKKVEVLRPERQGKPWSSDEREEIKMKHQWNVQDGLSAKQSYRNLV